MKFIKPGNTVTLTAPAGDVVAGTLYLIGKLLVLAKTSAAEGEPFEGATNGVFEDAPKATGQAWTEGAKLYWDDANDVFTTTATANTAAGIALSAQASAEATGTVMLTGVAA